MFTNRISVWLVALAVGAWCGLSVPRALADQPPESTPGVPAALADEPPESRTETTATTTSKYWELEPIRFVENYFSINYQPSIEWDWQGGSNGQGLQHKVIRNGRALNIYFAGATGKYLSWWIQYQPLNLDHGLFTHFEMTEGHLNFGNATQNTMIRGGKFFNTFNGVLLGLSDRTVTLTMPMIYQAFNGYNPGETSRGVSYEYTMPGWTTGKIFMYINQPTGDVNPKFERSRGLGVNFEKIMSKKTLSGVSFQSVYGWTPTAVNHPFQFTLPSTGDPASDQAIANGIATGLGQPLPMDAAGNLIPVVNVSQINMSTNKFQRFWVLANKAFNDSKGYERVNGMFGFLFAHDSRNFSLTDSNSMLVGQRAVGYGYTFELLTIPIARHLFLTSRYDQFRPNNHQTNNTMYQFTLGAAIDMAMPNRPAHFDKVMRHWERAHYKTTFDYQIAGQRGMKPIHRFIISWWPAI